MKSKCCFFGLLLSLLMSNAVHSTDYQIDKFNLDLHAGRVASYLQSKQLPLLRATPRGTVRTATTMLRINIPIVRQLIYPIDYIYFISFHFYPFNYSPNYLPFTIPIQIVNP